MNTVKSLPTGGATATADVPRSSAATLAKGALRRLALQQLQPTPENYARAYAEEASASGGLQMTASPQDAGAVGIATTTPPVAGAQRAAKGPEQALELAVQAAVKEQAQTWVALVERLAKNLERGGRHWTVARRRQSLGRVLMGSRSDPQKLQLRLVSLMTAWEDDLQTDDDDHGSPERIEGANDKTAVVDLSDRGPAHIEQDWQPVLEELHATVRAGLNPAEQLSQSLSQRLLDSATSLSRVGATSEQKEQLSALCEQARAVFGQRHRLVQQLTKLSRELCASMVELAEEGSWARGQCEVVQSCLYGESLSGNPVSAAGARHANGQATEPADDLSVRAVKAASQALQQTRVQQERLRGERLAARDALKQLIHGMLLEVNELGDQTGRFQSATAAHAEAIGKADSLQELAGVVKRMLADSQAVQAAVSSSQQRLQADRDRAAVLEDRVQSLEGELQRLSTEVSTDALTQVANRRGLAQAFATETARCQRQADASLALGLIDIDNFKKLNDSLGHAAGDVALKTLAAEVKKRLRPVDHLARFGGEEFVVLLPDTAQQEAQQALSRLQRSLTEALFLHEGREVFVTFSAGVTLWQPGETMESALERADGALYDAKRTGKNRTCVA